MTTLTQGPLHEYGAMTDRIDEHTTVSRYASGGTAEWHGPFAATVIRDIHLSDGYGRFDGGREVAIHRGTRVFVTRYHSTNDPTRFFVLDRTGRRIDVPADKAPLYLTTERVDGQLVYVDGYPAYVRAVERHAQMMAR
jgi:hypothetical protein